MSTELTIKQAAYYLDMSVQRVRTLCRSSEISARKIGNSWLIDEASLKSYGLQSCHEIAENHPAYNTTNKKPIALSFFSGAMGLDLGIEKSGFEIRLACEVDKYCRQTITLNRPNSALLGDINKYTATDIRKAANLSENDDIDLIIGGPPCQAFSTAGKRKGLADERGNVFLRYLKICLELKPKYFVIENVRGLLSCPFHYDSETENTPDPVALSETGIKGSALSYILRQLRDSGYGFSFNLYNTANFGTPQIRERVIIICSRDGSTPPFLTPTHSENGAHGLKPWKSLRQAIKNIEKHHHLNFPEKRLKYYRLLKPGQNWRNLPTDLQKEALGKSFYSGGGKTGFLRRLSWEKPSPTLVTHPTMPATDLAHPEEDRPLSIEEYKRIQEFPDSWKLSGPLIQQYKQIGNAVPVGFGYSVGILIKNLLSGIEVINPSNFQYSRYKNSDHYSWKVDFDRRANANTRQTELKLIEA